MCKCLVFLKMNIQMHGLESSTVRMLPKERKGSKYQTNKTKKMFQSWNKATAGPF